MLIECQCGNYLTENQTYCLSCKKPRPKTVFQKAESRGEEIYLSTRK